MDTSTFILVLLGLFSAANINISFGNCIERERQALLTFKKGLKDPSNRLSSWASEDCCTWRGVNCDNTTGRVVQLHLQSSELGGEINPSLQQLKHLNYLDLSLNDFEGFRIPEFIGSLHKMRYLNLSRAGFSGTIPHQLGNLSSLHYLDLSSNIRYSYLSDVGNLQWLSHLSSLQHLDMSYVNLSKVHNWLQVINTLPSLLELHLSSCDLDDMPALPYVNFTSLAILDLSVNNFNSSMPDWLYNLSDLVHLDLSLNHIQGKISIAIGNLTSLKELHLGSNDLEGGIPRTLVYLCNLQELDFGGNKLSGEVSGFLGNSSGCIANSLKSLDLQTNQLSGLLPNQLGHFTNLDYLSLSYNSFSGPIPESLGKLSSLTVLDLTSNRLNGTVPESLRHLSKLEQLRISYNSFGGVVSEVHFANLLRLQVLEIHSVILKVSFDWIPPFQLVSLTMRYCQLGTQFPAWLRTQKDRLEELDLSSTGISDTIPTWFWNLSSQLTYLNLSHNQIKGELPSLLKSHFFSIGIYLSSNHLKGQLPRLSSYVRELDLSNNSFSGPISRFLCNPMNEMNNLRILDLSENLLSGDLPRDCWMYWKVLKLLKLEKNNLTGNIPSSMGSLLGLQSLHMRNNSLSGELPLSLQNCTKLRTIDLGENGLSGSIPAWMGKSLPNLIFLRLRSNKFNGGIPLELCHLTSLQMLDLAHNNLSGTIPRCFSNFSAMATKRNSSKPISYSLVYGEYVETASLVTKGRELEYSKTLTLVTTMDLSGNSLSGEIPEELTSLLGLRSLNLSENYLTGKISAKISEMGLLESLDFSLNQLSGVIPQSMSSLNFLSHLNLSYNNLSGKIPSSTQLQSFSEFSYIGNHGLCGPPLKKNCSENEASHGPNDGAGVEEDEGSDIKLIYASVALGFVVGFWSFFGVLIFKKSWRFAYFRFIDNMQDKLCIMLSQ